MIAYCLSNVCLSSHPSWTAPSTYERAIMTSHLMSSPPPPKTAINGEKNCRFTAGLMRKLQESYRESLDVLMANAATPCKKAQAAALCDSFVRQPGDAAECRKCLSLCSLEINKKGIDKSAWGKLWSSSSTDPPSPKQDSAGQNRKTRMALCCLSAAIALGWLMSRCILRQRNAWHALHARCLGAACRVLWARCSTLPPTSKNF